jgi:hypothetical protein
MNILLGFLPFLAFAILSGPLGAIYALIIAAILSAGLMVRGRLAGASPKILEIGTLVLFVGVAIYSALAGASLSLIAVRLIVDCGLLAVVVVSMLVRRPFTSQYAREQVAKEFWHSPSFVRTNYVITAGWALAFLIMVLAEAALLVLPQLPQAVGFVVIVLALLGAAYFTQWYAKSARQAALPGTPSDHVSPV